MDDKRNRKGKAYNEKGNLLYDGDYLNSMRKIQGKEYDEKGILRFEGEYRNVIIWNGKGYNDKGQIEYEIKKGTGKGKEYKKDILIFEGEYLNGNRPTKFIN